MRTKIPGATIDDCRPPSKRIGLYHISFPPLPWSRLLVTDYVFQRVARTYAWLTRVATDF